MEGLKLTYSKKIQTWILLLCVFLCYTGMYAVRKSFLAGQYTDMKVWWDIDPKILLVISQVLGYMVSKFVGIKIVSEMHKNSRVYWLIGATSFGLLMLGMFSIVPDQYKFITLFLNGLPLGMIFGIVFSYIEGRSNTELLAAALSATFIFSTGVVKTAGLLVMQDFGVSEFDMPFLTGLLFFPVFLLCAMIINKTKGPSKTDIQARTERKPMYKSERKAFLKANGIGFFALVVIYIILTIVRDFRDNFVVEFWREQGNIGVPKLISLTEIPVAIVVLVIAGSCVFIKSNTKAFNLGLYLTVIGALAMFVTTILFKENKISPISWMIISGIGVYLPYILFHCLIFERLVALLSFKGNVGFLFYTADSLGYFGSVVVLLSKELIGFDYRWTDFFIKLNIQGAMAILLVALLVVVFFKKQTQKKEELKIITVIKN